MKGAGRQGRARLAGGCTQNEEAGGCAREKLETWRIQMVMVHSADVDLRASFEFLMPSQPARLSQNDRPSSFSFILSFAETLSGQL